MQFKPIFRDYGNLKIKFANILGNSLSSLLNRATNFLITVQKRANPISMLKEIKESQKVEERLFIRSNAMAPTLSLRLDVLGKGGESIRRDLHFSPTRIKLKETRMEAKVKKCDSR